MDNNVNWANLVLASGKKSLRKKLSGKQAIELAEGVSVFRPWDIGSIGYYKNAGTMKKEQQDLVWKT